MVKTADSPDILIDSIGRREVYAEVTLPQTTMEQYGFTIKRHVADYWLDTFDKASIFRLPNGNMKISGNALDQARLNGMLSKIRDLELILISVEQITRE